MQEHLIIICHDEKAQTYDALNLTSMIKGKKYIDCIRDYSDYERYDDIDIVNLSNKIEKEWKNVKEKIEHTMKYENYEIAYNMNGFSLTIEKGEDWGKI